MQSLNEQLVLRKLSVNSLPNWHITGPRARYPPRTQAAKMAKVSAELERMLAHAAKTGDQVDSVHLSGEGLEQWKLNDLATEDHPAQCVPGARQAGGQSVRAH
jgi:hypothetical protein